MDASSADLPSIGPYRVLECLGQGGAGAVYRCAGPGGRGVAVKLARIEAPDDALRFQRECRLQRQLGGEGLLPLLDEGQSEHGPYAVLPLVEGGTLHDRLRRGSLPWPHAVRLVRRLAEVAGRMHAAGVVHRDLKPANVLLAANGEPWVADLGLSKHSDGRDAHSISFSQTGAFAGTPGYMAPEQAMNAKAVGPAADVFSLGAILYTSLTGREPFAASSPAACVARSSTGDFTPLTSLVPDLPPWVAEVVHRALASDPQERPPTGSALATLLVAPPPVRQRSSRRPRRLGPPLGAAAGVLLGLGLWAALGRSPATDPAPQAALDALPAPTPTQVEPAPEGTDDAPTPDSPSRVEPAPEGADEAPTPDPPPPPDPSPPSDDSWAVLDPEVVLDAPGGHESLIREVEVDLARAWVLTGTISSELRLWDATRGALLAAWRDPRWRMIEGVGFGRGAALFAATESGALLRAEPGGDVVARPSGHPRCMDLDTNPSGTVVTCGNDGLRVWTADQAEGFGPPPPLAVEGALQVARFHPAGGGLALGPAGVWRWSPEGAFEEVTARVPQGSYQDLGWSPDGSRVATLTTANRVTLYAWPSLEQLAQRQVYDPPAGQAAFLNTRGLCFSADGTRVLTAGADPEIRAWSLPELEPAAGGWRPGWAPWTERVRVGPQGSWIAGGNAGQLMAFAADGSDLWPARALRPFSWVERPPGEEPFMAQTPDGLDWLDAEGTLLALNTRDGLRALDVPRRALRAPGAEAPPLSGQRMAAAPGRVACVVNGGARVARVEAEGAVLRITEHRTLSLEAPLRVVDASFHGARLLLGLAGDPRGAAIMDVDPLDRRRPLTSPAFRLGGAPCFGDVRADAGFSWVYGPQALLTLDADAEGMRWSPDRLKEGRPLARPPTYVTGTSAWAVYAYAPDLCVIEDLRGEAPSRSLRLPRLRALRVWDAGLVVSYGDAVAFLRLDTGEVVDTKPLRGDLVANLAVSPTGDAAYVWTQRGRVLRFGIRRDE